MAFAAVALGMAVVVMSSCSTQKNTGATRAYHAMKTKYNIRFNGELAYDEGIKAIDDANQDDFFDPRGFQFCDVLFFFDLLKRLFRQGIQPLGVFL